MSAVLALSAAPAAAAEEGGATFSPGDLGQAVMAIVIFLILLAVLGKWAWKPIVEQLHRREVTITQALERAEQREKEAMEMLGRYKTQMEAAQADAMEVIRKSRKDAAAAREDILAAARQEAHKTVEQAGADIERAKRNAMQELFDQTLDLASTMAGRILRRSINPADHREILAENFSELGPRAGSD
jgi:F-type H+-transporting ATPase subunit b